MKLYLAAPYAVRDVVRDLAPVFEAAGHTVTCGWLQGSRPLVEGNLGTAPAHDDATVYDHALGDLSDIQAAQVVVNFTAAFWQAQDPTLDPVKHKLHSGGRHFEMGYAFAEGKLLAVVGEPENIFQRALSAQVADVAQLLDWLDTLSD